jgi:hypothetical protein
MPAAKNDIIEEERSFPGLKAYNFLPCPNQPQRVVLYG